MRCRYHLIASLILTSFIIAQPKISGRLGMGYSSPDYKTFAENPFPSLGITETMMVNFSFTYQVYSNARVGFSEWISFTSDKYEGEDFSRSIKYRAVFIETYFFPMKKLELNFTLGPLINSGSISLTTEQTIDVWDNLMEEFNNSSIDISSSDKMTTTFFGFTSSIGARFYLKPYLAIETQIGFMENYYSKDNWSFQGKDIKGPNIDVEDLPLFTFGMVYGW
ncbi:MAG: hypothetical protein QF847_07850 [Candidatus Marinimicrobia bacterium]|jgi:hypothetical protein|nr:hypothetical protein [Candidatus Neomarinimicrobiota bacterium]|tara:strand:- start:382 stop:1047 length:666 start_codon:yes stop_codon:yes gene_type:complete